jgi:hypothetical protein
MHGSARRFSVWAVNFLRKRGFSKAESGRISDKVLMEERRPPESIFDVLQDITRLAPLRLPSASLRRTPGLLHGPGPATGESCRNLQMEESLFSALVALRD